MVLGSDRFEMGIGFEKALTAVLKNRRTQRLGRVRENG